MAFAPALGLTACGPSTPPPATETSAVAARLRTALAAGVPIVLAEPAGPTSPAGSELAGTLRALDAARSQSDLATVTVDDPAEGAVFPPDFVTPTFLWHDTTEGVDAWLVRIDFATGVPLLAVVPGPPPEQGWIDTRAIDDTNEVYKPTEYQASARSWTPPREVWIEIQARSVEAPVTVTFAGFATARPAEVVSRGDVRFKTSADEVGAPVFYRDVPLMPAVSKETGEIKPLAKEAIPLIEWRLRDLSRPDSKVILTGMRTCANCHSFSLDGKNMGLDLDSPEGDKGGYAITPLERQTTIDADHMFTWNSFHERPTERKTIGFLSRISPDGRYAMTTLNESIYAASFADFRFLQVFFVTRGILAYVSADTHEIRVLPGADDPRYVHCNPVWTPDGKTIVFARARAFDASMDKTTIARFANDPREPQIRFDLYRIPFNGGKGGEPVAIEGASDNGMSNTFPKVSPDGKWLVYTQCRNAQLMRPDGRLRIVPVEGGESREMTCNTRLMNSWHSFSPNGRWMVFSSKSRTPYTQLFITHIDQGGNDTPAVLVPNCTAANRAVNLPEFLNRDYDEFDDLSIEAVGHESFLATYGQGLALLEQGAFAQAATLFRKAAELRPDFIEARVNHAFSLRHAGDREGAKAAYAAIVVVDPANTRANGALESLLAYPDDGLARIPELRAAVERPDAPFAAWRELALALARADAGEESAALLVRVVDTAPQDVESLRALAHVRLRGDRAALAVPLLLRVLELDPADVRTRVLLAWQFAAGTDPGLRDASRAVELARDACNISKFQDARAVDAFAAALAAAGDMPYAIQNAELAARLAARTDPELAFWIDRRLALYKDGHRLGE